jgi:hypothetical protein
MAPIPNRPTSQAGDRLMWRGSMARPRMSRRWKPSWRRAAPDASSDEPQRCARSHRGSRWAIAGWLRSRTAMQ